MTAPRSRPHSRRRADRLTDLVRAPAPARDVLPGEDGGAGLDELGGITPESLRYDSGVVMTPLRSRDPDNSLLLVDRSGARRLLKKKKKKKKKKRLMKFLKNTCSDLG